MSYLTYIASDYPLKVIENAHDKIIDGVLQSDREVVFDIDAGEIRDGGLDDDFALLSAEGLDDIYTEKKYTVYLEWHYYTEGRAGKVIDYIRENLAHTGEVEIWKIWMGVYEKPNIRTKTVSFRELSPEDIRGIDAKEPTIEVVEGYEIPTQYRLVIKAD